MKLQKIFFFQNLGCLQSRHNISWRYHWEKLIEKFVFLTLLFSKQKQTWFREFVLIWADFYEYGWGDSFHFGIGQLSESRLETITALEHYVALKLGLKEGMKVADLGCGVGGPLRSIASFSGADITGLTINEYQVKRAESITKQTLSPNTHKNIHFL